MMKHPIEPRESVYLIVDDERVGFGRVYYVKGSDKKSTVIHDVALKKYQKRGQDLVVVGQVQIFKEAYKTKYPYSYGGIEDPPDRLGELNKLDYYKTFISWDSKKFENKSNHDVLPSSPVEVSVQEHLYESTDIVKETPLKKPKLSDCNTNSETSTTSSFSPANISSKASAASSPVLGNTSNSKSISAPFPSLRRKYTYRNRKQGTRHMISALRANRLAEASRPDNPFEMDRVCCKRKCFENVDKKYAWEIFKQIMRMDERQERETLTSWMNTSDMKIYFNGSEVCYRFLSTAFKFSQSLIASVKGTPKSRSGRGDIPRMNMKMSKADSICSFLENYSESVGDRMPHENSVHLPNTEKESVYATYLKYYRRHHESILGEEPPTNSYFLRIWKRNMSSVKARKTHSFTKCSVCERYRVQILECGSNENKKKEIKDALQAHVEIMRQERQAYYTRRDKAIQDPARYCSFIIDGADQTAYGLPHFVFSTKSDKGHKLKVKCVGVLEHLSPKKRFFFTMTEEHNTGANHVIEALHRTINHKYQEELQLPPTMFIQVDNCTRENKNKYFLSYLESLVARGVFQSVQVSFLPVGHTHEDIDQSFSVITRHLKHKAAHTLSELHSEMAKAFHDKVIVANMDHIGNYSGLVDLERCVRKIPGVSQYRYFSFTRSVTGCSSEGFFKTTCVVKRTLAQDWFPLLAGKRVGFLQRVPNLANTPSYETNPPSNASEVLKCFDSAEDFIKSQSKLAELRNLHKKVYEKREEQFHWNLETTFETTAKFTDPSKVDNNESTDDERDLESADSHMHFSAGSFVALNPSDGSPFWIAKVIDWNKNTSKLQVLWYEGVDQGKQRDPFNYTYKPIENSVNGVHSDTVFVSFPSLTAAGKLRVNVIKALQEAVDI